PPREAGPARRTPSTTARTGKPPSPESRARGRSGEQKRGERAEGSAGAWSRRGKRRGADLRPRPRGPSRPHLSRETAGPRYRRGDRSRERSRGAGRGRSTRSDRRGLPEGGENARGSPAARTNESTLRAFGGTERETREWRWRRPPLLRGGALFAPRDRAGGCPEGVRSRRGPVPEPRPG